MLKLAFLSLWLFPNYKYIEKKTSGQQIRLLRLNIFVFVYSLLSYGIDWNQIILMHSKILKKLLPPPCSPIPSHSPTPLRPHHQICPVAACDCSTSRNPWAPEFYQQEQGVNVVWFPEGQPVQSIPERVVDFLCFLILPLISSLIMLLSGNAVCTILNWELNEFFFDFNIYYIFITVSLVSSLVIHISIDVCSFNFINTIVKIPSVLTYTFVYAI